MRCIKYFKKKYNKLAQSTLAFIYLILTPTASHAGIAKVADNVTAYLTGTVAKSVGILALCAAGFAFWAGHIPWTLAIFKD